MRPPVVELHTERTPSAGASAATELERLRWPHGWAQVSGSKSMPATA